MASDVRPITTRLLNMRSQVGDSPLERREHCERVARRTRTLSEFWEREQQRNTDITQTCIDPADHGPPHDYDIAKVRRMQKKQRLCSDNTTDALVQDQGVIKHSRGKHAEVEFQRLIVDATDDERMANVHHARRNERAVIGRNFVPISVDDLPEAERAEYLRAAGNSRDLLNYRVRNSDYLRDYWREQVQERTGQIQWPPFGRVGVC